jgi:flagellar motor switch protein FliN/FliY
MSNENLDTFAQVEQIVVAGASALREALGVPVTARDVQEVADVEAGAPADGVVFTVVSGSGQVVVAGGAVELALAGDADAIVSGLANQIAAEAGAPDAQEATRLATVQAAGLEDAATVTFELAVDGNAAPIFVAIESTVLTGEAVEPAEEAMTVARAPLPDLGAAMGNGNGGHSMNVLSDVSMRVTVQLGHTELRVRDLLGLSEGSVVELDQAPGTPVDVLVNGTAVARGDVVVVHDELGVRITEVLGRPE